MTTRAILYALLSAVLFGISTPTAKALLGSTDPTVLAGLLYCGAGVGVALIRHFVRPRLSPSGFGEVALKHRDLPWLAGAIIAGGVVGPMLLLAGVTAPIRPLHRFCLHGRAGQRASWHGFF